MNHGGIQMTKELYELIEVINSTNDDNGWEIDDLMELIDSKDRAPKKKLKPIIKQLRYQTGRMTDALSELGFMVEEEVESHSDRVKKYDELVLSYTDYKMINIEQLLEQLRDLALGGRV